MGILKDILAKLGIAPGETQAPETRGAAASAEPDEPMGDAQEAAPAEAAPAEEPQPKPPGEEPRGG
ncbi:hypothetical protein [Afifella pfennigii]|uniref:hypothetical protein n=1 Tax=Afifella pfennigii TaxID=209897 RepID=UPI00047AD1B3|nr:hypothetical protein [Afifella pfennigii]